MPDDWAQTAVDDIVNDLCSRRGLSHAFAEIDHDIQEEIRETWAAFVRKAYRTDGPR